MDLIVTFPGNMKVDAEYKGFSIKTDQPQYSGGDGSAPAPFDLFLASIGTCGGIYVVYFCTKRGLPVDGIRIVQRMEKDPETKTIKRIILDIELPADFPEKYKDALIRAVDLCSVKRYIMNPPEFQINTVTAD